jgi:hypothetical protein
MSEAEYYSRTEMRKDNPHKLTQEISLLELIISGVSSWLIGKLLDFTWRRAKGRKLLKNGEPINMRQVGEACLHFSAKALRIPDAFVIDSVDRNSKFGTLKGFPIALRESIIYSIHNS